MGNIDYKNNIHYPKQGMEGRKYANIAARFFGGFFHNYAAQLCPTTQLLVLMGFVNFFLV